MTKKSSTYHLFVIAAFIGVLLTFLVFYLVDLGIGTESRLVGRCYDGSVIEGESFLDDFNRVVYQNNATLSVIEEYRYRLFDTVNHKNVLSGKNDFLFEVSDEQNGYHYLEDYKGNCSFSDDELAAILNNLQQTKASYEERGAEFLLVILPNAQTVYSDYMPAYLGDISDQTRLDGLEQYLRQNGFTCFVNLTDDLRAYREQEHRSYKEERLLYNNTENSLNSLGFYYVYRSVYDRFSSTVMSSTAVLEPRHLSFYQHLTAGKAIAQQAGLVSLQNKSVSLSKDTKLHYRFTWDTGLAAKTMLLPFDFSVNVSGSPPLLLQTTDSWTRAQLEPFFSNTFSNVTYQTDLSDNSEVFEKAAPRLVIRFVYENELSQLLPQ